MSMILMFPLALLIMSIKSFYALSNFQVTIYQCQIIGLVCFSSSQFFCPCTSHFSPFIHSCFALISHIFKYYCSILIYSKLDIKYEMIKVGPVELWVIYILNINLCMGLLETISASQYMFTYFGICNLGTYSKCC